MFSMAVLVLVVGMFEFVWLLAKVFSKIVVLSSTCFQFKTYLRHSVVASEKKLCGTVPLLGGLGKQF